MRYQLFFTLLLSIAILLVLTPSAWAHPGHDHSVPTGVWHDHDDSDATEATVASDGEIESPALFTTSPATELRINSWLRSDGTFGSSSSATINNVVGSILADVNTVAYNNNYTYIRTTGVPSHAVGPFNNPSVPGDVDATYRIIANPTENTGTKTSTGLGSIGVMVNGAGFYNASDGTYWNPNNNGLTAPGSGQPANTDWSTNALWYRAVEQQGMDDAGGHPSPVNGSTNPDGSALGFYHYHRSPIGLLDQIDPGNNGDSGSPIIGFAFDGYPVVGPFAFEDESMTTTVQMKSSYGVFDDRSSFASTSPTVGDYAMGSFLEDFTYIDASGNLNEYNMAFVKFTSDGRAILTDETDLEGDWAYFATLDALDASHDNDITRDGDVSYPYIVGPEYYGIVDNMMPMGGSINVPANVSYFFEYDANEIAGDYDNDGDVDQDDYQAWQLAYGTSGNQLDADGNHDGFVNAADYTVWRDNYVSNSSVVTTVSVPEANTMMLIGVATLCQIRRRSVGK